MIKEEEMKKVVDTVLEKYPSKTFKNRKTHIAIKTKDDPNPVIQANSRTVPGVLTSRGCCYAGCKGVVMGPIKNMVHITHGPIGCSFYTWGGRRFKAKTEEGSQNFNEYVFSTDMQESDIVFGGEKKLRQAIKEAVEMFHPNAIGIYATCPVGLIGDDIQAVAKEAEELYNVKVHAFNCEGYKGVSQSAGHHIANNIVFEDIIGHREEERKKYSINILGEYNIGGDGWEIERVLEKIGYNINSVLTGDTTYEKLQRSHLADLNIIQCHRSINYIAEMMETKFGIPWIKGNFIGVDSTIETLRNIAKCFDDQYLYDKTEQVISEELAQIEPAMEYYREKLKGKTACLYVGGSRALHYQMLLNDFGVETILAGFEFAHRDDYEGREVIPTIKIDADGKNIPEITVSKDEERYRVVIPEERYKALEKEGVPLAYFDGMVKHMEEGTVMVDDLNHHELDEFVKMLKPDMFLSGIKEKYVTQKMGILSRQLHSYDYLGPYAGFKGALIFVESLVAGAYTPAWQLVAAPWDEDPVLMGKVAGGEI